jgi:ABC-type branched-subunit amino acid transport system ATPase component
LASEALMVRGVDTYYGDSHVLHGVGFALQAGRLLGLLGRNGAGKTTCMATIMGFLRPRRGAIDLFGEPLAGLAPSEGLAPQIVHEVGRTIAQLKAEGLSIVLVEQNIKLTLDLADDVVIVNTGAVVFSGTAAETRTNDKVIAQHLGVF